MSDTNRIIKKYPNRRLYDTAISSYITLDDVRRLIIEGESVQVLDVRSGEDLTRQVLLQIISEHEQQGQPVLSERMLSQIIRFYGDSMQGFMGNYLERSMQLFMDQQQQLRSQFSGLIEQTPWNLMNQLTERNMALWKDFQRNIVGSMRTPTESASTDDAPKSKSSAGSSKKTN